MQTTGAHSWVQRVARMSLQEIIARATEMAWWGMELVFPWFHASAAERAARRAVQNDPRAGGSGAGEGHAGPPHATFFCFHSADRAPNLPKAFQALFSGHDQQLARSAESIGSGALRLFGESVVLPSERPQWHQDWHTGRAFPTAFWGRVPVGQTSLDPKRIWELNRQQFLVTLGQSHFHTRRESDAQLAVRSIESWIAANPPFRGVNWKEALEPALRLLSWLWVLRLLEGSSALNPETERRIVSSIAVQRDFIRRHLSVYSSPNTHLLGEALALFVTGLALPDLRDAHACALTGQQILEKELRVQVATDGSHREKSAYYHCYALEMYLLATILGRQHGIAFSPDWNPRIERMAEFLKHILRPDGSLARFGDDDGGKTLRLAHEDYYHPRSLLAVAAVLFARGDFKVAAGQVPEEVFWLLGAEGVRQFDELQATPPGRQQEARWFPDASLGVVRTGWSAADAWLPLQGNPMGMLTAGHSHAAPLHVELFLGGQLVLVDPGTYSYAEPLWRDHFRSAEAHNVVSVDELAWAQPVGPFRWQDAKAIPPPDCEESPRGLRLSLAHPSGVYRHTREVELLSANDAEIRDHLTGSGTHELAFWLHFSPRSTVLALGNHEFEIRSGGALYRLSLHGFASPVASIQEGQTDPPVGWFSPGYNRKLPAPVLCIREHAELPAQRILRISCVSSAT